MTRLLSRVWNGSAVRIARTESGGTAELSAKAAKTTTVAAASATATCGTATESATSLSEIGDDAMRNSTTGNSTGVLAAPDDVLVRNQIVIFN